MAHKAPQIAIIGAGLSGLTLALGLSRRGIAAVIYDRAASAPPHKYGITLHSSTYRPLLGFLDMDEGKFRETLAVDALEGRSGAVGSDKDRFRCQRGRLEALLAKGLRIEWNKKLKEVKLPTAGSRDITTIFEDGTTSFSTTLIGCDGPHSMTRQSLSSKTKLQVLPYVVFNGKRRLSREDFKNSFQAHFQESVIKHHLRGDVLLEVSINDFAKDHVDLNWVYSRPERIGGKDPLHKPDRPITGAEDITNEFYEELDALTGLDSPFKEVFNSQEAKKDRILHWLMRCVESDQVEAERLAKDGVVLIGDSVHATPILGGEGANAAIQDGLALAEFIATNGVEDLASFSKSRYDTWRSAVTQSKRAIGEMHASKPSHL